MSSASSDSRKKGAALLSSADGRSPAIGPFAPILARLGLHMTELDRFLREQIDTFEPEIREMAGYCVDTTGKRIRPILVFLSGWRNSAQPSPEFLRLAAVVELVHLATLVHDDIMDEAEVRRGRLTATRAYGPVAAVLLGDALFSHALFLASQFPLTDVCRAVSESTRKVCAGEIIQTMRRRSIDITEVDYRRIIDLKTAELFRVSCMLGTRLAGYPETYVEAASHFGRHLGIAYQVYDDLADYVGEEKRLGKTLGTDLVSGKLTLPLLLLMERLSESERAELLAEIRGQSPVRLSLHLEQMQKHGVFRLVAEAVEAEILAASKALADWSEFPSTGLLLSLCGMLREQLAALWPPARV